MGWREDVYLYCFFFAIRNSRRMYKKQIKLVTGEGAGRADGGWYKRSLDIFL